MTVAQEAALRWLARQREQLHRDSLLEYYERNGPTFGLRTVARRGAAGRMFWRLYDDGYLEQDGRGGYQLTESGREAAFADANDQKR